MTKKAIQFAAAILATAGASALLWWVGEMLRV